MSDSPLVRLIGLGKGFVKGKDSISIFNRLDLSIPSHDPGLPQACGELEG